MIIFGTRGITSTAESGNFYCPRCQGQADYRHRRVRRFFTLYFIPLIPLDRAGEYIECDKCAGTYAMEVLDLDPTAGAIEFEAEFQRAVKQVMVDMMLADGSVDDQEIEVIRDVYGKLAGREISDDAIRAEILEAESSGRDVSETIAQLAGHLNSNGKEMVIKAAFLVAAADGVFEEEEKRLIETIAEALDMSKAHLRGVLATMAEVKEVVGRP